jgi:hypothetical protein
LNVSIDVSFALIFTPRDFADPLVGEHVTVWLPAGSFTLMLEPLPLPPPSTLNEQLPPDAIARSVPIPPAAGGSSLGLSGVVAGLAVGLVPGFTATAPVFAGCGVVSAGLADGVALGEGFIAFESRTIEPLELAAG